MKTPPLMRSSLAVAVAIVALLVLALVLASGRFSTPPESWRATTRGTNDELCERARTDAGDRPAACAALRSSTPVVQRPASPRRSHASALAA